MEPRGFGAYRGAHRSRQLACFFWAGRIRPAALSLRHLEISSWGFRAHVLLALASLQSAVASFEKVIYSNGMSTGWSSLCLDVAWQHGTMQMNGLPAGVNRRACGFLRC